VTRALEYDVAIVGGGPAGASLALHLVRREGVSARRIVVLDKARFPRDKPCAGAVSKLGLDVLARVGVEVGVPSVAPSGVRVLSGDGLGESAGDLGVVVRRVELDAHLLEAARRDGVHVIDGDGVRAIERSEGRAGFVLTGASGTTLSARFIAAADGSGSTTRKLLRIAEPARKGHLYVLETGLGGADVGVKRQLLDFDLCVLDDGVEGYYWDFPTVIGGELQVSRGIYHANLSRSDAAPGEPLKDVLARALAKRGVEVASVKLRPFSTRPFVPRSTAWVRGVVLVGEACGIDRTTGEGIAQSIEMGRIAAEHLARATRTGSDLFHGYERAARVDDGQAPAAERRDGGVRVPPARASRAALSRALGLREGGEHALVPRRSAPSDDTAAPRPGARRHRPRPMSRRLRRRRP
jgi:flavin-dependent dehydrogenase